MSVATAKLFETQAGIPIALFLTSCILYSNTLYAGFTFDDNFAVVRKIAFLNLSLAYVHATHLHVDF
jgi:hypothetical protein